MAINAPTSLSNFTGFLNPQESAPIFNDAAKQSAFQQLIRRVPLGINGQAIPVTTGKPTAKWTAEGAKKHATETGLELLHIKPQKLTAFGVLSAETVRANPGNITQELRTGISSAFATAFDLAVAYNVGGDGTGTGPFDNYLNETTKSVELGSTPQAEGGIHGDFTEGLSLLVNDGKKLTGWALDDTVEPMIWGAVDGNGRPLYTELPTDDVSDSLARPGRLLNRPSFMGEGVGQAVPTAVSTPYTVGFGGNFAKAAWGAVGGINFRVSTEATVTINGELVSAFENNLVIVLAEAEYGFVVADPEAFVKLTETTPAA